MAKKDEHNKKKQTGFPTLVFLAGMGVAYYTVLRPQMLKWGTQADEAERALPGDELIMHPGVKLTHAVTIDAPTDVVWAWLAQMGRESTGFYAVDALDNNGVSSAQAIRSDLPPLAIGTALDNGFKVLQMEAGQSLVIGGFGMTNVLGAGHDVTYAYLLQKHSEDQTRLLCRVRLYAYGLQGVVYNMLAEPALFGWMFMHLNNLSTRAKSTKQHFVKSKQKSNGNIRMTTK